MPLPSRQRVAIKAAFGLNALAIAVWFPRIPDVKAALDVDLLTLSICFFMLPLGTLASFAYAAPLIERLGARRVVMIWGGLFALLFIPPAFAWSAPALGVTLFAAGLAIAPIEIGMNAKASVFEHQTGRRIMTQCHAMWSFGAMGGALIGGVFAEAGIGFLTQQLFVAPLLAGLAVLAGRALEDDRPDAAAPHAGGHFALPDRAILWLCAVPIGALLLEGAMMEWSALYLQSEVGLTPGLAAAAFAAFSTAMGGARLGGDWLAGQIGTTRVIRASCYLACGGLIAFATALGPIMAIVGAALLGLGCANIYPLSVSLAAAQPTGRVERNIAALTFAAFSAFLIGPPLIGLLGSAFGLGIALLLLAPLTVYPPALLVEDIHPKPRKV